MKNDTTIKNGFKKVISQLEKQGHTGFMFIQVNENVVYIANSYTIIAVNELIYNNYIAGIRDYLLNTGNIKENSIYSIDLKTKELTESLKTKDTFSNFIDKGLKNAVIAADTFTIYQQDKNDYPQRFIVNNNGNVAAVNNDVYTAIYTALGNIGNTDNIIYSSESVQPVIVGNELATAYILPIRQGFNSKYQDTIKALSKIYAGSHQILKAV